MASNNDNYDVYKKRPDFLGVAAYHTNTDWATFYGKWAKKMKPTAYLMSRYRKIF